MSILIACEYCYESIDKIINDKFKILNVKCTLFSLFYFSFTDVNDQMMNMSVMRGCRFILVVLSLFITGEIKFMFSN